MAGVLVLVVDDNAENRALAQATLEDDGFCVVLARDGAEAIAAFEREHPACILMDIQMPVIDGVAACERIRALPGGAGVAIVFVTAQRDIATFDRALAAGGDDFLTKPFRPSELVVRVQAALRVRKLAGERSELYAQVKRQRDDLQRLQLQKEQLVAFLVHDLKNPVNSIELQAQRLLRASDASERARSAGAAIRTEARALLRMIMNLLDLARSDEGRLIPASAAIDAATLAASVVEELQPTATAHDVELGTEVTAPRPINADPDLVHRTMANLVENAIRHSPEHGVVRIAIDQTETETVVRVIDGGTGVPPEQREAVFERYVTSGGARNRGLGLAFCRAVAEAHGGAIWIEDAGPGAIFCVRLPA